MDFCFCDAKAAAIVICTVDKDSLRRKSKLADNPMTVCDNVVPFSMHDCHVTRVIVEVNLV